MSTATPEAPTALPPVQRRNAELVLIGLTIVITMGAMAVSGLNLNGAVPGAMWGYGLIFGAMALATHVALRFIAPYADPLILPCALFLNGIGVAMIWRLDAAESGDIEHAGVGMQLIWTAVGMVLCIALLFFLKEPRVLQRYTYVSALVALVLIALPMVPGLGISEFGARRWIGFGGFTVQPSEFAKIALVVFLSSYLVTKRQVLSLAAKQVKIGRFKIMDLPRARDFMPMVVGWVAAIGLLVITKDLGTSLLLFGTFLAMLYVATQRSSWVIIGVTLFLAAATLAFRLFWHFRQRVDIWFNAYDQEVYYRLGGSEQLVKGQIGMAYGGTTGTGMGGGQAHHIFAADSDFILASLGEDLGLTGLMAILVVIFLLVERGMRIALASRELFVKMLASGLAFVMCFQVFVVLGGLTRTIPLTGMTTPFLAAGGSALMASWLMIGLLLRMSDNARSPAPQAIQDEGATQVIRR
ncbi:cell division protein FtsW [Nocardiopsis terrae]|uniref:Cell division protein FtsW (Lipid II flippase) n=1 Tax=Nocardiopsis terrae TaxID=372655 RepID=A0ABR9HPF9_9ACTN|nr:FtsW/RodA/SpoVE family cell cycle protein [Nocardiopsis terrae]MBE1460912.1 cell division protein FtsW (lipid II flippase) [Nocardiopsis terrae]GHC97712.1 cell division protein FtsW [Nocardiopsis terrae]